MLSLTINGQLRQLPRVLTLTQLLEELSLIGKRVAVEQNGDIVPRSQHGKTVVHDGDRIEIVVAVGGG
ncbi:MAG TPA: sulfur carrier protein ThiS [Rhodocyclaceae bacterium]|nr:sulfur carrier protein ThiS [Rhodocyclaceae bacterium]